MTMSTAHAVFYF